MGFLLALILLIMTLTGEMTSGKFVLAEGGPSTFGYDASSACSKPYSRIGRARLENLPCDFRRENWCTIAGNTYPWQAVRRFVQENQGLMRRMYGDEKHINVMKTELEKNDVELELVDENDHNPLFSDDTSSLFDQYPFDYEYDNEKSREFLSRSLNPVTSGKLEKSKSTEDSTSKYSSHPNETPTSGTTSYATSTTKSTSTPIPSTTTPMVSLAQIAKIQNLSINEIPGQIDRFDSDVDELTEIPETAVETTVDPDDVVGYSTMKILSSSERIDEINDGLDADITGNESQQQQQFRPRPEYRPPDSTGPDVPESIEGQLFQDVAAKDKQEPPVLKVRGINACPVKEEVVAPFWANNTRGEVLALLNLYPFEQYVHWEKCTHENKQMYCRDGCRCEQQYRLHRLLAYDPNNECRGIFSDWFKFPSCCICRCYDLPVEFRVTSRSPRTVHRQRLKVRAPRPPPKQRIRN